MHEVLSVFLKHVSVPIRGLFNLTILLFVHERRKRNMVSVPIRGLFNLTLYLKQPMLSSHKSPLTAEIINRPQTVL